MALLIQLVVLLIVCGILLGVARAMPVTTDPWLRWGVYAIAALIVCVWLLGMAGMIGTVPWRLRV